MSSFLDFNLKFEKEFIVTSGCPLIRTSSLNLLYIRNQLSVSNGIILVITIHIFDNTTTIFVKFKDFVAHTFKAYANQSNLTYNN